MICGKKDQEVAKKGIRKEMLCQNWRWLSQTEMCSPPPLPWGWGGLPHLKREHMFPSATGMEISARGEAWVL